MLSLSVRFSQMAEKPRLQCRCPAFKSAHSVHSVPYTVWYNLAVTGRTTESSDHNPACWTSCHWERAAAAELQLSQLRNNRGAVDVKANAAVALDGKAWVIIWWTGWKILFVLSSRPSCASTDTSALNSAEKDVLKKCQAENGRVGVDGEWRFNWCLQGLLMPLSVRDPLWVQKKERNQLGFQPEHQENGRGDQAGPQGERWGGMRYSWRNVEEISPPAEDNFSNLGRPYLEDSCRSMFSNACVKKTPQKTRT